MEGPWDVKSLPRDGGLEVGASWELGGLGIQLDIINLE